eukprot:TRINITY_DN54488_c0_g1_i1.p1 TRINITY_DN54488_c0_g1~~TRINITY_DN54488_c0_g1_i1.p1  ORF type:complete len:401 (+),score=55.07 TRINITY_DN54488_c0_g1_i1:3-1205(+)
MAMVVELFWSHLDVIVGVVCIVLTCLIWKWSNALVARWEARDIESKLTILITTSASESNPSTTVLEAVFASFGIIDGLRGCRKIVVFDWPELDDSQVRNCREGRIQTKNLDAYNQYIQNVQTLCGSGSVWENTSCKVLSERHGFGWAVKAALEEVKTDYVLVVQHDRCFVSPIRLRPLLKLLANGSHGVNYLGFPVNNQSTYRNPQTIAERHAGFKVEHVERDGICLLPLLMWYDTTHLASVKHYKEFVLPRVQRGDFIEEGFGIQEVNDIVSNGMAAHQKYGNYLVVDSRTSRRYCVAHLEILRSKGPERHKKEDYGLSELCRVRRCLREKLKGKSNNERYEKQLLQRIGLLKRLMAIGALSAELKPQLDEVLSLASACKMKVPTWKELVVHKFFQLQQ